MTHFPSNPYEDVEPSEFNKDNKKHASEYFIAENFKEYGWFVYEPFTDTGIDRIIEKKICPNGHTPYAEDTRTKQKCEECAQDLEKITRFIQIKTREIKEYKKVEPLYDYKYKFFGFTLSSADFRTDPRHIFLLYSDNTIKNKQQDVHIIPISCFLDFMINNYDIGMSMFSTSSFRVGNNKQNWLNYKPNNTWVVQPSISYSCFSCTSSPILISLDAKTRITVCNLGGTLCKTRIISSFVSGVSYSLTFFGTLMICLQSSV